MIESQSYPILEPLAVSAALVVATVTIHMIGLAVLMRFMQARSIRLRPHISVFRQSLFIIMIVLGLVAIHAVEIWLYTVVYIGLGEFVSVEEALYFSITTFTTVGFGDVLQSGQWRLVGAVESFNGFLLIGWSTAFLVSVISRLRSVETDWLDRLRDKHD
jgi:Ion channel